MKQSRTLRFTETPGRASQSVALPTRIASSDELDELRNATGWETYVHDGGAQSLAASTRTKLEIDGATSITSQQPDGVTLWDTASDTITGRDGDAIIVKVQCDFTPDDAAASEVLFDVDIGGAVGIVERQSFAALNGAGNPNYYSWTFAAYTLDTWETNGGSVYATADGAGDIENLRIVIARTHRAA